MVDCSALSSQIIYENQNAEQINPKMIPLYITFSNLIYNYIKVKYIYVYNLICYLFF